MHLVLITITFLIIARMHPQVQNDTVKLDQINIFTKGFRFDMTSELKDEGTEFKLQLLLPLKDDCGTYKIILESLTGRAESSAKLNVLRVEREPPTIIRGLIDQIVAEGNPIVFEIEVEGGVDEIIWLKDGQPYSKIDRSYEEKIGVKTSALI